MKTRTATFVIFLTAAFNVQTATAQLEQAPKQDPLFPVEGKTALTIWTGIPYISIAEYAYGISDGFSVGVVGGITPTSKAVGVRLRGIVAQPSEDFRLYIKAPILFYPASGDSHREPWFLVWPTMNAEWRFENNVRAWGGVGLVGAECAYHLLGIKDAAMEMGGPGFRGGLWNTFQAGVSKPVSEKIQLHVEVALVMRGLRTANDGSFTGQRSDIYWDTKLPVILDLGMSYAF